MQTFLPYGSPSITAKVLDKKRLGKQRVEGKQILDLLEGRTDNNWKHHPAVRMWSGYEEFLKVYINAMIHEWTSRKCKNTMDLYEIQSLKLTSPPWFYDLRLLYSHRANLVRKLPEYYGLIWPEVNPDTPYWWPVSMNTKKNQNIMEKFWGNHECVRNNQSKIILEEK